MSLATRGKFLAGHQDHDPHRHRKPFRCRSAKITVRHRRRKSIMHRADCGGFRRHEQLGCGKIASRVIPTNYDRSLIGLLIVISGPAAAGKTTIGREIAARRHRAIHIDGDFIQGLLVTGSVTMDVPPPPGALEQLRLRFQAALTVANLYRDAGFDAIISDNLIEEEAHRFIQSAINSHPSRLIHFVMLNPSVEAIWERYDQRPGGGYTVTLTPEVLKDAVERTAHVGLWLDTSHLTAGQTAEQVLERLDQAEVGPEVPTAGSNGMP